MEMRGSSGGGCCIARYTHHVPRNATTTTYPYDTSKMGRIMLRFRPIAPKPAIGGPTSTSSNGSNDNNNNLVKSNVVKRKRKANNITTTTTTTTSKARKDSSNKKSKSCSPSNGMMTTLPLLPETPDLSPTNSINSNDDNIGCSKSIAAPKWLCFGPSDKDLTAQEVFPSSVTVEGVSDAWLNGNTSRCTDEEIKKRLENDTCPGFISDGWNRVWWTNKEYNRMVTRDYCKEDRWQKEKLVSVKLEMRDKMELPAVNLYGAFTCKVKVQYGSHTMRVPCDVWRMNGGGFAWRLDVKAALSLGL